MEVITVQQLLLPTKKKCQFDLYVDSKENPKEYYTYIGPIFIDTVPNNKNHFLYKLMCAKLYLAGFKLEGLSSTFGYCTKTISHWGNVLKQGDSQQVADVFGVFGRGKITQPIESFITARYLQLLSDGEKAYSKKIISEIKDYFDISITGSGLRPHFRKADKEKQERLNSNIQQEITENEIEENDKNNSIYSDGSTIFPPTTTIVPATFSEDENTTDNQNATCENSTISLPISRKLTSFSDIQDLSEKECIHDEFSKQNSIAISCKRPPYQEILCHHTGLVLLLMLIDQCTKNLSKGKEICRQMLSHFLLGASNVEQGKTISKRVLQLFLGKVKSDAQSIRNEIYSIATLDLRLELLKANWQMIKKKFGEKMIFYYDPHSKKYNGIKFFLKGYFSSGHETAKVLMSDYIHTLDGNPCFVEHYDNFFDLRVRFFFTLQVFKKIFPENKRAGFTWIIDRGIYGLDVLKELTEKTGDFIITWEKGYKKDGWNDTKESESFVMRIPKNNAKDLKDYNCSFQFEIWSKNKEYRRIIFNITNPKGRTINLSILSSNLILPPKEIIIYMLRRWLQENDFAYLIRLFGIDQIDSYKSKEYRKGEFEDENDYLIKSQEFTQIQRDTTKKRNELKNELYQKDKKLETFNEKEKHKFQIRAKDTEDIAKKISSYSVEKDNDKRNKLQKKMNAKTKMTIKMEEASKLKYDKLIKEHDVQINSLKTELELLKGNLENVVREESRLDAVIKGHYLKPDTASKSILDTLRILARNMIYIFLKDFRPIYNNFRDDHVIIRALIRSNGKIQMCGNYLVIELFPQGDFSQKVIESSILFVAIIEQQLNGCFNDKIPFKIKVNFE